jgi:ribosome biogenesis protein Nip4
MNLTPLISVDFINLSENKHWMTAISDVNFSYYKDVREVISEIEMNKENLQCVVATQKYLPYTIALGESQSPSLYQYPDDVDIMKFLIGIL